MKKAILVLFFIIIASIGFALGWFYASSRVPSTVTVSQNNLTTIPQDAATTPVTVVSLYESASSSPMVVAEYPQFPGLNPVLNQAISSSTLGLLAEFEQTSRANETAREANGAPALPLSSYSFDASWQNAQVNSRYVSFIERYDYWNGGANDDSELQTFNYDVFAGKIMTLADLFPGIPDYLQRISRSAEQQLSDSLDASSNPILQGMINDGVAPTSDNFQNFTFTDYDVTIYFPKYAVAPGSFGEQKITIPRDISSL